VAESKIVGTAPKIWLGVPLKKEDKVLEIIATQSYDDPNYFCKRALDILTMVSNQIAVVIDQKRTLNELDLLRDYLFNIVNSMPAILIVIDRSGLVTQWNF
jgi:hypothetical protein